MNNLCQYKNINPLHIYVIKKKMLNQMSNIDDDGSISGSASMPYLFFFSSSIPFIIQDSHKLRNKAREKKSEKKIEVSTIFSILCLTLYSFDLLK